MQNLPSLTIGKHTSRLPIIQGGMGVGISGYRLAGAVAANGGIGTISGIGLPMVPAVRDNYFINSPQSLYDETGRCVAEEIRKAREIANGGPIFLNVMAAIFGYREQVLAALEAGIDGIVSGAGFNKEILQFAKDFPHVAFVPILSDAADIESILRMFEKRAGRPFDALILEDPSVAGGHLGAKGRKLENVNLDVTKLETSVPAAVKFFADRGLKIPVIGAGGIVDRADIDRVLRLGGSGVQMGMAFYMTFESGAHEKAKAAAAAVTSRDDLIDYQSSACMPARALRASPVFARIAGVAANPAAFLGEGKANLANCRKNVNCLQHCALRDGYGVETTGIPFAQMCIADELLSAVEGNDGDGLYFASVSALRINTVRSVREIMAELSGESA